MYAQPDKKPRGSKKNQQEAPPHTQEQLAEMYSQPDKSKKQQSQGVSVVMYCAPLPYTCTHKQLQLVSSIISARRGWP